MKPRLHNTVKPAGGHVIMHVSHSKTVRSLISVLDFFFFFYQKGLNLMSSFANTSFHLC